MHSAARAERLLRPGTSHRLFTFDTEGAALDVATGGPRFGTKTPGTPRRMRLEVVLPLPSDGAFIGPLRDAVGNLLSAAGAPDEAVSDVQVILGEACANALTHAQVTDYRVEVQAAAHGCVLRVSDQGRGLPPGPAPGLNPLDERGRGLLVIRALADEVDIDSTPDGTVVRVAKSW